MTKEFIHPHVLGFVPPVFRELAMDDFWRPGHPCTLLASGEEGIILACRRTIREDGWVAEYHVHFPRRKGIFTVSVNEWLDATDLLVTGLTKNEQEALYAHLKANGMDDDAIGTIMTRHGCTPGHLEVMASQVISSL